VDIDPHIARARRRVAKVVTVDKRPPSRKGLGGVGMQHRFREGYRQLAARDPARWVVVDNDQDLSATVDLVTKVLATAYRQGAAAGIAAGHAEARTGGAATALPPPADVTEALGRFLGLVDQRMEREPQTAAYLLSGLFGPEVDERRRKLVALAPETVIAGLAGLVDPVSWQLREELADQHPARVARTLGGAARLAVRAQSLRARLFAAAPFEVLSSLDGADDDEAWSLRDRAWPSNPDAVMSSLAQLPSARAWEKRERWLGAIGGPAALAASYDRARLLGRALLGLDDERAWELRKLVRETAPISALASVKFVLSERAWKWRDKHLERAPKTVFETLARVEHPRAWPMRQKMAPLVKEAIDSINGLDGSEAWQLREDYAEVWPSTVVKTLGPLADTPAGQALVLRQLGRFPGNISLLKHVAAIAVGAHLDPDVSGE
jgi:dTMP kinase